MLFLSNAFSINMLSKDAKVRFGKISVKKAVDVIYDYDEVVNAIGHPTTDAVVRAELRNYGAKVPAGERRTVALVPGDRLLVAQYRGPRLPEGATELPPDASIEWWLAIIPEIKEIYLVDLDSGEMSTYRFDETGKCIEGGKYPFDPGDVYLSTYLGNPVFNIYEGSHWEHGDRDETVGTPGVTENGFLVVDDYDTARKVANFIKEYRR